MPGDGETEAKAGCKVSLISILGERQRILARRLRRIQRIYAARLRRHDAAPLRESPRDAGKLASTRYRYDLTYGAYNEVASILAAAIREETSCKHQ